jgi:peptide/nickel transport system substrate-binding protein
MKQINRRKFLQGTALAAGATVLAACAPAATPAPVPTDTTAPVAAPQATDTTAPAMPTDTAAPVATDTPAATATAAATATPADPASIAASLPRKETLYFNGQQWGALIGWNPYSSNMNNAIALAQGDNARVPVFETPYMYNMLDGKQYPLLADGPWAWDDKMTQLTFKIKAAAKWSDGSAVTADDVAYTWATNVKYGTPTGLSNKDYIDTITASDAQTVVVKAKLDASGKTLNPLIAVAYVSSVYVVQKAWTQTLESRTGSDATKLMADPAKDFVASGPYMKFFDNEQKVVYVRNENYWGKDASMWGKLPVPKYLAHVIYKDNDAGTNALKAGEVDVSQQFNANVQDLWLKDKLPISTYMDKAPYSICASLPTAYFNLNSYGLDNPIIRKAIAIAVDYDTIIANAMTNQSPTFAQVPRSVMNPTTGEQALYDHDAVKDLQWVGNDVDGAKKMLDDAGIKAGADGFRTYKGKKLSYKACCPNGWSDWQAAMEIVAAAGKKIGIDITTLYPEWAVYQTVFVNGDQKDYDIFMVWSNGAGPTNPWGRVRQLMSSEFAGTKNNQNGNWGGYKNPDVDKVIQAIPSETDAAKLKEYYTTATKAYLTDIPSFTLMYRPQSFHTVNETVWTGYPSADDGKNIPPLDLTDGYSIAGLYNLTLVSA